MKTEMKLKIFSLFAAIAAMASMSSCSDSWNGDPSGSSDKGDVSLASIGIDVNDAEHVVSRATVDVSGFQVIITNKTTGAEEASWRYADMPEIFTLPVGDYKVNVVSHTEQPKAAWDTPYYSGDKEFSIVANKLTEVGTVTCRLANLKVSIRYSDKLLAAIDNNDAKVDVKVNDSDNLSFLPGETRSGYYEVVEGNTTLVAEFTGTISGNVETMRKVYTDDVKPGYHRIITFSIKTGPDMPEESGTVNPSGITIDATVTDVDVDGNVIINEGHLPDDDRPGHEGGDDPGPAPVDPPVLDYKYIAGDANVAFGSNEVSFTGSQNAAEYGTEDGQKRAELFIKVPAGIAKLIVDIESDVPDKDTLEGVGLAKEFDLCDPTNTVNGDLTETLKSFGFPVGAEVIDQTDLEFNISQFMPLLCLLGEGTHTFNLIVTDNSGHTVKAAFTFITLAN